MTERLAESNTRIHLRQKQAGMLDLEAKADFILEKIRSDFLMKHHALLPRQLDSTNLKLGHLEHSSLFLAAVAFKHAVKKDEVSRRLCMDILKGLEEMDKANGKLLELTTNV